MLARSPGWSAAVVLSFALGVGANMAIFSLTYAVVLKGLPVPDASHLIRYTFRDGDLDIGLSGPLYNAMRRQQAVATDLFAWSNYTCDLKQDAHVEQVHGALISGSGFGVLGVRPFLGRVFGEQDDQPGGGSNGFQAMLGHDFWRSHFHADRTIIGQVITVDDKHVTVIGILPAGFESLNVQAGNNVDIMLPLSLKAAEMRNAGVFWLTVMGRLKPGQSLASARANLAGLQSTVRAEGDPSHRMLDGFFKDFKIGVEDGRGGRSFLRTAYEKPLAVLAMLAGALLLLCCANTALLIFARVSARTREFALRGALGAGRGRLLRQVLAEILLLACAGLAAAVGLGWVLAHSLVVMLSTGGPPPVAISPNLVVLSAAAILTLGAALAAGLWPAIRASRVDPTSHLKQREQGGLTGRAGGWIVQVQVAVSVTLVAGALLLGNSFLHLLLADSGFRTDHVTFAEVDLSSLKLDLDRITNIVRRATETVEHSPGITSAAAVWFAPFSGWSGSDYSAVGKGGEVREDKNAWGEQITPGYFSTLGTRILEGRGFEESDMQGPPVCVISFASAQYFFPGEDPVGKTLYSSNEKAADPKDTCRVVGLAEDARYKSLREPPPRLIYSLMKQALLSEFVLAVRSPADGQAVTALRQALKDIAPGAPAPKIYTFSQLIAWRLNQERMLILLSGSFAAVALLLTAVGLFGLLMRGVTERTHEIGVRVALGARPRQLARAIFLRTGWQVLTGIAAGSILEFYLAGWMKALLTGVSLNNAWIYVATTSLILAVGLVSSAIPLRRAISVDPMEALRSE